MRKKIVSLLLAVCLVCGLIGTVGPVAYAEAEEIKGLCGVGLHYVINPNTRTLTISGTGELGASSPWRSYSNIVDKIIIEPGITAIGGIYLFDEMSFTEVVLPDGLTKIGASAFSGCSKISKFDIPDSVTVIDEGAFSGCSRLAEVKLPSGLTEIGGSAFSYCGRLKAIDIPSSVKKIGDWAFSQSGLESVVIPASVTSIGERVFFDCSNLKTVIMLGGGTTLPRGTFDLCESLEHIKLPDNLKTVEYEAFRMCNSLTRIDFPMSVTYLNKPFDESFFVRDRKLKTVVIPNPECVLDNAYTYSLGKPGQTTLYTKSPSVINYAISYGYNVQDPGTEPEDDWNPPKMPSNVTVSVTGDYVVGGSVQITASAQDAETITVIVEHNGKEVLSQNGGSAVYVFPETGTYEVYARAANQNGSTECERQTYIVRTPEPGNSPSPSPGTPTPQPADKFKDVPANHYARNAINWAVANKITGGMSTNLFGVGKNCDRSQAVFFIWAAEGRPEPTVTQNPFVDVKPGSYYYKAVLWAKEKGVTGGVDSTHFGPTGNVTRGQIMTFLYAAQGKPPVSSSGRFTDVKSSDYYSGPVSWAAENGISSGKGSSTTFKPKDNCKREEIVTFLFQAYK